MYAPLGVYSSSSWYRTEPLHATLAPLIDFELLESEAHAPHRRRRST